MHQQYLGPPGASKSRSTSPRRSALQQRRSQDTRRKLIRSALELWNERGFDDAFEATTAEEIARLAGVSKGTFYFHFAHKEDILLALDRALAARRAGVVPAGQVVDLRFSEFKQDPLASVAALYETLGLELTADAEARMRAFLDAHPGDPDNALRRYSFADTGLDEAELRERVRDYQDHFGVESETLSA